MYRTTVKTFKPSKTYLTIYPTLRYTKSIFFFQQNLFLSAKKIIAVKYTTYTFAKRKPENFEVSRDLNFDFGEIGYYRCFKTLISVNWPLKPGFRDLS